MSLPRFMSDTHVYGPEDALRKLSNEYIGLKFIVVSNSYEVLNVFVSFDDYEKFTKDNIATSYGVVVVEDSDKDFPVSEESKYQFRFVNEQVELAGDHLLDYLYRCDGKWLSLLCDNADCCPTMGKPINLNGVHYREIIKNSVSVSE